MNDYQPCFSDVGDDWRKRWTMLRNFLRSWYSTRTIPVESRKRYQIPNDFPAGIHPVGNWGKPVEELEVSLGVTLPPSLREWHSLFHQTNSNYFNLLRDDHAMQWSDLGEMLVIRVLCEGNLAWGVRKSELAVDDPVVHEMQVSKYGDDNDSWLGTEWTYSGSLNLTVSEWLIHNINWYLTKETQLSVQVSADVEARDELLKEVGDESQRQSRFGPFMIFESTNRFVAYQKEPAATEMQVFFAKQIDFAQLPSWIVRHSNDRRIDSGNANPEEGN